MNISEKTTHRDLIPSLAIVLGGVMWGLYWLPLRAIGGEVLTGVWPGALLYAGIALVLLPILILRWRTLKGVNLWRLAECGLFTGAALTLYSTSLFMTDVVRSILLFYLTPVWSTALGLLFLGERLSAQRIAALVLGFSGLLMVLGIGEQVPWPQNAGDWLALISGMSWAYGSFCVYRMPHAHVLGQMSAFVMGSFVVSMIIIAVGGSAFGGAVQFADILEAAPTVGLVVLFVLPMIWLTLWPATRLSPGRVGLLLMGEVVVGVASAAWLSGETFGLRELLGACLITLAGIVEVVRR